MKNVVPAHARLGKLKKWYNKYLVFKPGIIYAYSTLDPKTRKRDNWAYIGQTRQPLITRHNQHMGLAAFKGKRVTYQPWSDLYPQIRILYQFNHCNDWFLCFVEKWTIKFKKPTYNYQFNTRNPNRVPKYVAEAERKKRDLRGSRSRGRIIS